MTQDHDKQVSPIVYDAKGKINMVATAALQNSGYYEGQTVTEIMAGQAPKERGKEVTDADMDALYK